VTRVAMSKVEILSDKVGIFDRTSWPDVLRMTNLCGCRRAQDGKSV